MEGLRSSYAECGELLGSLEVEVEQCNLKREDGGEVASIAFHLQQAARHLNELKCKCDGRWRAGDEGSVSQSESVGDFTVDDDEETSTVVLVDREPHAQMAAATAAATAAALATDGGFDVNLVAAQFMFQVAIVYSVSPAEFYVHVADETKRFQQLSDAINEAGVQLRGAEPRGLRVEESRIVRRREYTPAVGERVLALYSLDKRYYRAVVRGVGGVDGDDVAVTFVDYGNGEVVSVDDVVPLPPAFADAPHMATRCSLVGQVGLPDEAESALFVREVGQLRRLTLRVVDVRGDGVNVVEIVEPFVIVSPSGHFQGVAT